jgi:signal transduction histidine kinase
VLPAAIAVLGLAEMAALRPRGWGYGVGLELVACILLIWRRRHAQVVAPVAMVVLLAMPWFGPQLNDPSVPILIWTLSVFSLARWVPDLRGLVGVGVIGAAIFLDYALVDQRQHSWSDVIFVSVLIASPYVLGRVVRKLSEQTALLEQQQELVGQEAARAERDRIARELHDVIAHSVSAMVVQTAAAQDLVVSDPDRAAEVLEDVAATGRRALAETGRLLHVIRDEADELGLRPAPGLGRLPELVDGFRANGLEVQLEVDGPLRALPVGLDVSAYRITQEALTNALKYAADRAVSLRLTFTPASLSIHTSNTTSGKTADGSGLGLVGMAERVSLFGGRLTHGLNGDGRFELTATLPVPAGVS